MGKYSDYRKVDELDCWDLDSGSRRYVNQSTSPRRKLKERLRRQARKKISRRCQQEERI